MSDQNPSKVVTIDACKVVDRARELLAKPGAAYFFDGAVGVIAHEFAEHSATPRLLSEQEHDLVRFAAGVTIALDEEFDERLNEGGDGYVG